MAIAAVALASCYATYDRGVAAANARDWPAAEGELWRYLQGGDCVGHEPLLACKQAAVRLGEVLIEDDRSLSAAAIFRFAQKVFYKQHLVTPEVDRDLNIQIANGLVTAKQRWDQFRSGAPGQCHVTAHYRGPGNRFQLVKLSFELDLERIGLTTVSPDPTPLFDRTVTPGPHAVTTSAMYVDPARPAYRENIETTLVRSCRDGDTVDFVFSVVSGSEATSLKIGGTASGGQLPPRDGPLRPNPRSPWNPRSP